MSRQQRIGILFGSFDPVSRVQYDGFVRILDAGEADRLLVLPVPADDVRPCAADAEDRWKMLVAACSRDKRLVPCRLFLDRKSDSPAGILAALEKEYPGSRLCGVSENGSLQKPVFRLFGGEIPAGSLMETLSSGNAETGLGIPVLEYCRCKGLYGARGRLENIDAWTDGLFAALKPRRFAHSLSVAYTARRLALLHGLDPLRAEQAGLLHDCAKCLPLEEMQRIALDSSLTDDPEILRSGALLHSVVGARVALEQYGMEDPQVLDAIRYHNTGCPGMSRLAMCVCLADSIEPLRDSYPLLEQIRALAGESLERALLLSLESTAEYVTSRGYYLHPRTRDTVRWLKSLPDTQ